MMPFAIQVAQFQLVTLAQFKLVTYNGVRQPPLGELLQAFAECGGRNAPKAGQLVHGGQGRGAEQQERILKTLAQRTQRRVWPQAL